MRILSDRLRVRRLGLLTASLLSACSLYPPDDAHFAGGTKEPACKPAPPCSETAGPATHTLTPDRALELPALVDEAPEDSVIELAAGTYGLVASLTFSKKGVTLRSASGNPADVTINGQGLETVIEINASNVTLSGFTLTNVSGTGALGQRGISILALGDSRIVGTRLCGLVIRDAGSLRFVESHKTNGTVDCGRVEGALFQLTAAQEPNLCCAGCLPPHALVVYAARDWVIRRNAFDRFACTTSCSGNPPFSLLVTRGSRSTLIENNCIFHPGRGIGLGTEELEPRVYADEPYGEPSLSHIDGMVRNNVIVGGPCYDTGIEMNYARRPVVIHNTVVAEGTVTFRSIDARYPPSRAFVWNNLVDPRGVTTRDGAELDADKNVSIAALDFPDIFSAAAALDFHLLPGAASAIDQGAPLDLESGLDLDGEPHDPSKPDIGADELGGAAIDPLTPCSLIQP